MTKVELEFFVDTAITAAIYKTLLEKSGMDIEVVQEIASMARAVKHIRESTKANTLAVLKTLEQKAAASGN